MYQVSNDWKPNNSSRNDDRLHRDRWTAVGVVALIAALMGILIWLATLSGGSPSNMDMYWPMMP
jgi:hypothetical protein